MSEPASKRDARDEAVASYKQLLRSYIDRRPSGTRRRIAIAIGKHKSFISQVTNPSYRVPLPAQHIPTIMEICHFSPEERRAFLEAYALAHPNQSRQVGETGGAQVHTMHIEVPAFDDPERQRQVIDTIREMAARIIALGQSQN